MSACSAALFASASARSYAARLVVAVEANEQLGAGGVEQVIGVEVEGVDDGERRRRTFDLGEGDRAVERDDGVRGDREELVVELENLAPVGCGCGRGVAVDGVDRGLDLVRTGLVALEAAPHDRLAFGDEVAIPTGAVLVGKQHHGSVGRGARGAA